MATICLPRPASSPSDIERSRSLRHKVLEQAPLNILSSRDHACGSEPFQPLRGCRCRVLERALDSRVKGWSEIMTSHRLLVQLSASCLILGACAIDNPD